MQGYKIICYPNSQKKKATGSFSYGNILLDFTSSQDQHVLIQKWPTLVSIYLANSSQYKFIFMKKMFEVATLLEQKLSQER
jgi:hypothetical protein